MIELANTRLHQRKPSATFRSHVLCGQFALPNSTGTGKTSMNHYCHLPYTKNTETRTPEMNSDWSDSVNMEVCLQFCSLLSEEFTSHSQHHHADIAPTIPMSRPNVLAHRRWLFMSCHACETHILAWNVTFLVLAHLDVSRWAVGTSFCLWIFSHVNNSGLCASQLVNLLLRWLLKHGTRIVHLKLTG